MRQHLTDCSLCRRRLTGSNVVARSLSKIHLPPMPATRFVFFITNTLIKRNDTCLLHVMTIKARSRLARSPS